VPLNERVEPGLAAAGGPGSAAGVASTEQRGMSVMVWVMGVAILFSNARVSARVEV
jgi:hypothetical protein